MIAPHGDLPATGLTTGKGDRSPISEERGEDKGEGAMEAGVSVEGELAGEGGGAGVAAEGGGRLAGVAAGMGDEVGGLAELLPAHPALVWLLACKSATVILVSNSWYETS